MALAVAGSLALPGASRIAAPTFRSRLGRPTESTPSALSAAWHVEHVRATAAEPSAMRARTSPPTPRASSTHSPYRAAAVGEVSATPRYGASCEGYRANAAAPSATSAGSVAEATVSGSASGAARSESTVVDAPPGSSSSREAIGSAGGFHSGKRSQSFASAVA